MHTDLGLTVAHTRNENPDIYSLRVKVRTAANAVRAQGTGRAVTADRGAGNQPARRALGISLPWTTLPAPRACRGRKALLRLAAVLSLLSGRNLEVLTQGAASRNGPPQGLARLRGLGRTWAAAVFLRTQKAIKLRWKGSGGKVRSALSVLSRCAPGHPGRRDGAGALGPVCRL